MDVVLRDARKTFVACVDAFLESWLGAARSMFTVHCSPDILLLLPQHLRLSPIDAYPSPIRIRSGGNKAAARQTSIANESPGNTFTRRQRDFVH